MSEDFEIFKQKNKAYGNSFESSLDKHGIVAALVRMDDKMERLATLNKMGSAQVGDESIIDTATDLGNYALMLACLRTRLVSSSRKGTRASDVGGNGVGYCRPDSAVMS